MISAMSANPYRSLPRVDAVIRALEGPQKGPEHALYAEVARASVESAREAIAAGEQSPTLEEVVSDAKRRHALATHRSLR